MAFIIEITSSGAAGRKPAVQKGQRLGVPVPEALVLSLTTDCPEACSFCGSADHQNDVALPEEVVVKVIKEGKDLGVFTVILAGGEPLLRPELVFQLVDSNKDMLFLLSVKTRRTK